MCHVESREFSLQGAIQAAPQEIAEDAILGSVLARALYSEPNFEYVLPDERVRRNLLPLFFRALIRTSHFYGQIDTTPLFEGAALWISPEQEIFSRLLQAEELGTDLRLDRTTLRRFMKLGRSLEKVRKQMAGEPHWYLTALGVEPSKQRLHVSRALLQRGLLRADSDGLPCYLETFQERDLLFFEELGFAIAGAGRLPSGPSFWAMMRRPPRRSRCL